MLRYSSIQSKLVALGKRGLQAHILALFGTGIILTLPTLLFGFPDVTDDAAQHVLCSDQFTKQFVRGSLPAVAY